MVLSSSYPNEANSSNNEIRTKMEEFNNELSKIVGLHKLKEQLQILAKGMFLDERRRAKRRNLGPRRLPHMSFLGNPGTGKTTVARILGKLLNSVGVLSSDKVIEVQKTDLVAEYIGHTRPKTKRKIRKSLSYRYGFSRVKLFFLHRVFSLMLMKIEEATGGILFIDEAYQLAQQRSSRGVDFCAEAMEEIMSVMEDGNLVVVFAGYTDKMKLLFSSNIGFFRRVEHFFVFENYSCKDLAEMVMIKMSKMNEKSRLYGFKLHPTCTQDNVMALIEKNSTEELRNKMNGGLVDRMLNSAREKVDMRLAFDSDDDELFTITLEAIEEGIKLVSERANVDCWKEC